MIEDFEEADSDGDGKVGEAMACDQVNQTATSTAGDSGNAVSAADNESREARIMMRIMKLMHAYQVFEGGSKQTDTTGLLSVSA